MSNVRYIINTLFLNTFYYKKHFTSIDIKGFLAVLYLLVITGD